MPPRLKTKPSHGQLFYSDLQTIPLYIADDDEGGMLRNPLRRPSVDGLRVNLREQCAVPPTARAATVLGRGSDNSVRLAICNCEGKRLPCTDERAKLERGGVQSRKAAI